MVRVVVRPHAWTLAQAKAIGHAAAATAHIVVVPVASPCPPVKTLGFVQWYSFRPGAVDYTLLDRLGPHNLVGQPPYGILIDVATIERRLHLVQSPVANEWLVNHLIDQ